MKYNNKLSIIISLTTLIIFLSCQEKNNPVAPINTKHSKILFRANQQLHIISSDGTNHQIIPIGNNFNSNAILSSDASKIVYESVGLNLYKQISLYDLRTGEVRKITDDSLYHEYPNISSDGKYIVYVTSKNWHSKIFIMNLETGETKNLNDDFSGASPKFFHDGTKLIFSGYFSTDSSGIITINTDGTNPIFLGEGSNPEISPDELKILYQKFIPPYDEGLYIMNTDGSNRQFLSSIPFQTQPRFSPDGSKVIFAKFSTNFDIYQIDVVGNELTNLTNTETGETQPVFTADGLKIVFTQYDSVTRINNLCSMNTDGTAKKIIFQDSSNYGIRIY